MPTQTPYYDLWLYNATTDQTQSFLNFRTDVAGNVSTSNMNKIDTALNDIQTLLNDKIQGAIPVSGTLVSSDYSGTSASITTYTTNLMILFKPITVNPGTCTLNINTLGAKTLAKVDSAGSVSNLNAGDLKANKEYLFRYDGTRWIWASATSADQINIVGTSGNLLSIYGTNNTIMDSGVGLNVSGGVPTLDSGLKLNASRVPITDGLYISGSDIAARVDGTSIILSGASPTKTITHADTSSQASVTNTDYNVIQSVGVDTYGHVTSLASRAIPVNFNPEGRLSYTTGVPITSDDVSGATTLYYIPFEGDRIALYNTGTSKWDFISFAETSVATSALTPNCMYNIWGYSNSGTLALELETWGINTAYNITAATAADPCVITYTYANASNAFAIGDTVCIQGITGNIGSDILHTTSTVTAIGGSNPNWTITLRLTTTGKTYTSGGTVRLLYNTQPAIARQDGVLVKTGNASRRLLGFLYTNGAGTGQDTAAERYLANQYNARAKTVRALLDVASTFTQTANSAAFVTPSAAPDSVRNGKGRVSFITPYEKVMINVMWATGGYAASAASVALNLAQNLITITTASGPVAESDSAFTQATSYTGIFANLNSYSKTVGFNYIQKLVYAGVNFTIWVGSTNSSGVFQYGLRGAICL